MPSFDVFLSMLYRIFINTVDPEDTFQDIRRYQNPQMIKNTNYENTC